MKKYEIYTVSEEAEVDIANGVPVVKVSNKRIRILDGEGIDATETRSIHIIRGLSNEIVDEKFNVVESGFYNTEELSISEKNILDTDLAKRLASRKFKDKLFWPNSVSELLSETIGDKQNETDWDNLSTQEINDVLEKHFEQTVADLDSYN